MCLGVNRTCAQINKIDVCKHSHRGNTVLPFTHRHREENPTKGTGK